MALLTSSQLVMSLIGMPLKVEHGFLPELQRSFRLEIFSPEGNGSFAE